MKVENTNYSVTFDESGLPALSHKESGWFPSLLFIISYYVKSLFRSKDEKEKEQKAIRQFSYYLKCIRPRLVIDPVSGAPFYTLVVLDAPPKERACMWKKPAVETKHGNVIYHIENLNVYITADVVQQLNVNPQQVINMIKDQIQAEIEKKQMEKNDL